jgi:putative endonuclease
MTSDLVTRVWQHKEKVADGFTKQYGCTLLIWFELADSMKAAILREKQIKAGSRTKKLALIETMNPPWNDLYETIC